MSPLLRMATTLVYSSTTGGARGEEEEVVEGAAAVSEGAIAAEVGEVRLAEV